MTIIQLKKHAVKLSRKLKYIPGCNYLKLIDRANGEICYLSSDDYFGTDYKYDLRIIPKSKYTPNCCFIIWQWDCMSPLRARHDAIYQFCRFYLTDKNFTGCSIEFKRDTDYPVNRDASLMAMYFLMPDKLFDKYYKEFNGAILILCNVFLLSQEVIEYRIKLRSMDNV